MRAVVAVVLITAVIAASRSLLVAGGLAAAMYLGLRIGSWFALMALGEYERKQRTWRVRNWRRPGGG